MASNPVSDIAVGTIVIAIALTLGITVLPLLDGAIADYADGADDVLGGASTDDPSASNVNLLELTPLTLIASMVIAGVAFIVKGARNVRGS